MTLAYLCVCVYVCMYICVCMYVCVCTVVCVVVQGRKSHRTIVRELKGGSTPPSPSTLLSRELEIGE